MERTAMGELIKAVSKGYESGRQSAFKEAIEICDVSIADTNHKFTECSDTWEESAEFIKEKIEAAAKGEK